MSAHLAEHSLARAVKGKRGQSFLRGLVEALDSLPEPKLIRYHYALCGDHCALGAVAAHRNLLIADMVIEDVADELDVAPSLAQAIAAVNDESSGPFWEETPEQRWSRVRAWAASQIGDVR